MTYDPNLIVPYEVIQAVQTVFEFARKHDPSDNWQIGGLTPVKYETSKNKLVTSGERMLMELCDLQKRLFEITQERDHYKRLVELSDALRNAERGYGINPLFNANQEK